ncbi:hypothetical protein CSPAE12_06036 [Colletotrichum incanum]|nr:hypothetical protein CSPAE12_06036 [Colletotrichum incanum]
MVEPSYSRNELVSELTSYYEFLTQLFLPPEVVQYPPEGGWEHITPEFVDSFCLGKNDTVADLMKHIPYVRRTKEDDWEPWMVYESATAVDFTGDLVLSLPTKYANEFLFEPEEGNISDIPPHVKHRMKKPGAGLRETYTFHEFFTMAKEKFRKFEMTALNRKHVHYTSPDTPQAQIYREEGVFTERYNRERCMNRLDEYQKQKDRENRESRGEEELPVPPPKDIPTIQASLRELYPDIRFVDDKSLDTLAKNVESP